MKNVISVSASNPTRTINNKIDYNNIYNLFIKHFRTTEFTTKKQLAKTLKQLDYLIQNE